jgi:hypothetical protein
METEEESEGSLLESLESIREKIEVLCHVSKHMHTKAVRIYSQIETPDLKLWIQPFKLHVRAKKWAKHHMLATTCSLMQVHQVLVDTIKKENRILSGGLVQLTAEEGELLDLPVERSVSVWTILGKLPRFYI